ncbi:uncharacterized protein LOC143041944 [Mytilus galloprovincialis]|uniref:uncharacterized protein LOC143041944 n=1 Tax=Mytilus galloprovincialis TaxID=29158 RepID=UPI003F7B832B
MGNDWSMSTEHRDPMMESVRAKWYSDNDTRNVVDNFVAEHKKLKVDIGQLKKNEKKLQEENRSIHATFNECLVEQQRLKEELSSIKQENLELGKQLDAKQQDNQELTKDNNILSNEKENALSRLAEEKTKGIENEHKLEVEISNLKIEIRRADAKFREVVRDYETLNSRYEEQRCQFEEELKDLRLQLNEKSSKSVDSIGRQDEKPYKTSVKESEKITGQAQVCVNYDDCMKEKSDHLATDFLQLYEHYWKNAMTELRERGDENTNIEFLLTILKKAYSFSENMEKGLRGDFEQALLHASNHIKEVVDTTLLVREILEQQLTGCIKELFLRDPRYKEYGTKGPAVQSFITEAVSVCWLMVTRSPRVIISTTIPKESHSDSFNPYRKFGSKVDFVVWPVVKLSNDEGKIVCRGTAVFK